MSESTFILFLYEIISHPFVIIFILISTWIWIKSVLNEVDIRSYSLSFQDILEKGQYYRIFTAIFYHNYWLHYMINMNILWNLRYLESQYGGWYMLKYSIVLLLFEVGGSFLFIQCIIYFSRRVMRVRGSTSSESRETGESISTARNTAILQGILYHLQSVGSSGLLLSWLSFQSIVSYHPKTHFPCIFILFGFINISPLYAPLIMTILYYFITTKNNAFSHAMGLIGGFFLASGFLQVVPTFYWTICLYMNIMILLIISLYKSNPNLNPGSRDYSNELNISEGGLSFRYSYSDDDYGDIIEVLYDTSTFVDPIIHPIERDYSMVNRNREQYDEEALQPLLSTNNHHNTNSSEEEERREGEVEEGEEEEEERDIGRWRTFPDAELDISGSGRRNSNRRLYINEDYVD